MFYFVYSFLSIILLPLYILVYGYRLFCGKETVRSIASRLVFNDYTRPQGQLVWLHAASVGESMVALTLIEGLNKANKNLNFLITTGTLSSAKIISKWKSQHCYHQFTPNDNIIFLRRFLKQWQPDLALLIESELWPCMLTETAKTCPVLLTNARLSDNSFLRWKRFNKIFTAITNNISAIFTQSKLDMEKYQELGADNVKNFGNLKFSNKELEVNKIVLQSVEANVGNNPVFIVASTHKEDEEVIIAIIRKLLDEKIKFLSVIVLRHPERRADVIKLCEYYNLKYSLRSKHSKPSKNDDIYIVDTFGELGTFYSLSDIAFVGGSFKRGGHNLLEPAYFNCAIIVGPDMSNFQNITDDMTSQEAAIQLHNNQEIENQLRVFLTKNGANERKKLANNALRYVQNRQEILKNYIDAIGGYIK